jgi:hypothetical protein
MMNEATLKQIAAVKAMVNKGNHRADDLLELGLNLRGAFGQKTAIDFATPSAGRA